MINIVWSTTSELESVRDVLLYKPREVSERQFFNYYLIRQYNMYFAGSWSITFDTRSYTKHETWIYFFILKKLIKNFLGHKRHMTTWLVFCQVERGFHGWWKDLEPEAVLINK